MHYMIVIVCPNTKVEVPTGIVVNIKTFKESPTNGAQFRCPAYVTSLGRTYWGEGASG